MKQTEAYCNLRYKVGVFTFNYLYYILQEHCWTVVCVRWKWGCTVWSTWTMMCLACEPHGTLGREPWLWRRNTEHLVQENTQLKQHLASLQSNSLTLSFFFFLLAHSRTHTLTPCPGGELFLNKERNWATFSKSNAVSYSGSSPHFLLPSQLIIRPSSPPLPSFSCSLSIFNNSSPPS